MSTQLPPSLSRLASSNPVVVDVQLGRTPDAQASLERILASEPPRDTRSAPHKRSSRFPVRMDQLLPIVSVLVVVAIAVVFLSVGRSSPSGSPERQVEQIVYEAEPTPQASVTAASVARAVEVIRGRLAQLGLSGASIGVQAGNEISMRLPAVRNIARVEQVLSAATGLQFYDWEANALVVPSGTRKAQTVASLLPSADATALTVSQGSAGTAPGGPSSLSGALGLYQAVKLASEQPYWASKADARDGSDYYLFGASSSEACAGSAKLRVARAQCLLAGPIDVPTGTTRAEALKQLYEGLAPIDRSEGQVLIIKQGTVVLQAAPNSFSSWPAYGSPTAGYYVLKDKVALFDNQTTDPQQRTDATGAPDVTFGFTSGGVSAFQHLTATIAQRGQDDSIAGQTLDQHFAIALDNQLITVPSIDFKTYPDGIHGKGGDITGAFTINVADRLARELRFGALPIKLRLISISG
jgi:hypothetical protein